MFLYVRGSVCVRAPTAPVAGPGEALWEKEVTGGRGLWGCSESRVVESGKCWAHAGTGEPLSRKVQGAVVGNEDPSVRLRLGCD